MTDQDLINILRSFPELTTIPTEGTFNVVSEINNLKNTPYFSEELVDNLIKARLNKDPEAFKKIIEDAIISQSPVVVKAEEIKAIEDARGLPFTEEEKETLAAGLIAIDTQIETEGLSFEEQNQIRQELINSVTPTTGTRLIKMPDGTLQPFTGYFNNVIFSNIFTQEASVQEIVSFQNYLIENNIASPEDFAGTKGKYSERLRALVEGIMDWTDQNINAVEGTPLYNEIAKQEPLFFSDVEYQNMDVSFERNLFNYAVKEMAKANVDLKKFELEEELETEKIKYLPPRKETLDDMVEAYFVANTGRSPSAKELSDWSTELAKSYSESYTQLERFKYEQEQMNVRLKPTYETSYTVDPTTEQPKRVDTVTGQRLDFGGLQEMQPMTPAEIFEAKFEEELGGEMQSWEKGLQIKEMQNKIMSAMYGG
jgi:hypothetical protein